MSTGALSKTVFVVVAFGLLAAFPLMGGSYGIQANEGNVLQFQEFGNAPPNPPKSTNDDVIGKRHAVHRNILNNGGTMCPVTTPQVNR